MKRIKFLLVLFLVVLVSCERDDICAETTPTTPRLLIEFYDAGSPEDLKSVPRLTLYGEGLATDPVEPSSSTLIFNSNSNSIELPLIVGPENETTTTRFILEQNSNLRIDETGTSNIDIIEITYTSEFQYVSRACGFKSIFTNLNLTVDDDTDNWISSIDIIEPTVENENTVHVHIFH
ncbi:DUF6452 family protein [Winogradskyella tangerina]|uniref:DUF6452 family protein n=1 Tax=Winogradskyella tangerina TaxID=2023240 RepID=UPI000DBE662D|nr:DUF6452 family protein [Winogradskyella tangerina]